MSELSQSLIDAAGRAVFEEIKKYPTPQPFSGAIPGFHGATQEDVGRVAVVAVLETLAKSGQVAWAESLAGIAAEVRDGRPT